VLINNFKNRFIFSVIGNVLKAFFVFGTGIFLAKHLGPSNYGNFTFLIGSFLAIKPIFDLGTSSAFFTFISHKKRGHLFYEIYIKWLVFQFCIVFLPILFISKNMISYIWVGSEKFHVLLAFIYVFLQQQIWQSLIQIGESYRKTFLIQFANFLLAFFIFFGIFLLYSINLLSIDTVFFLTMLLYLIAILLAYFFIQKVDNKDKNVNESSNQIFAEYIKFCKPLALLSFFSFVYDFSDRWLLQKYGGSIQQGYFQISNQFASISLIITASVLNIFWKEISNSFNENDFHRVKDLFLRVSRILYTSASVICGIFLPWSDFLISSTLGVDYKDSWVIFMILLLFPLHQSIGQLIGVMYFSLKETYKYSLISSIIMILTLPITYMVISTNGLNLGAFGLAIKTLVVSIISVNIHSWVISRICKFKIDWFFQFICIFCTLPIAFFTKFIFSHFVLTLLNQFIFSSMLYLFLVSVFILRFPYLIGCNRQQVSNFLRMLQVFYFKIIKYGK